MSKCKKIWLIIATLLILLGILLFTGTLATNHWDVDALSTQKFATSTYDINQNFSDISIETDTADITFLPASDGLCKILCYEDTLCKHSVTVENNTLSICVVDSRTWKDYISITNKTPKISVYLPETAYHSLFIDASTSDIEITDAFSFQEMDISVSTGDILLSSIFCTGNATLGVSTGDVVIANAQLTNLLTAGNTGDILLKDTTATGTFFITRSTGDIQFDRCDAAEIIVKTSTGDVSGNLLTSKTFTVETSTGKINLPESSIGGKCEINTTTGDITVQIPN